MNTDDIPLAPKGQTSNLLQQFTPQIQIEFVHIAYEAAIKGCLGSTLLPSEENALLAFLIEQKYKDRNKRWLGEEIRQALRYKHPGSVFDAKSKLYNKKGDGWLQQVCGGCITITNSQIWPNKGYALINRIPVKLVYGSKIYPLDADTLDPFARY